MAHGTRYNMFWRVWLVFSWCLLAMACSDVAVPTQSTALTGGSPASEKPSNQAMPPGLQAAVKQARQEDASEVYAGVRDDVGRVALKNPAQRFATTVDANGIVVTAEENPWTWSLRTTAAGCAGAERAVRESEPAVDGNRVTYGRGEFEEWYLNGPMGFEQGFTWPRAPDCAGTKSIRMQVDGDLAARLNAAGDAVELVDGEGRTVLRYADLSVKDATGKTLSAWMTVGAGEWALHWEDEGATYPVVVDPVIATQEAKLLSGDTGAGDQFGTAVALSEDGQTAIVGAPYDDDRGTDAGAAYILEVVGGSWAQTRKLTASDGVAYDHFGYSVAISGNTVIVGAPGNFSAPTNTSPGSAYVFVRSGMAWTEQDKLTASDGAAGDNFGTSVALSGDTALVGANADDIAMKVNQGSAHIFVRNGTTWTQQAKLTASDGAAYDTLGVSVAISGDTVLVGALGDDIVTMNGTNDGQGSAYVFVKPANGWMTTNAYDAKLTASDGATYDYFGRSVALSGDTALVGAYWDNSKRGSAYVFVKPAGGSWPTTETAKLTASDGTANDWFGNSVALSGDTALVGAAGDDAFSGSAYVFVKPANGWMTTNAYDAKLTADDGAADDWFGNSVALAGGTALVGASQDDIGTNSDQGSAYVFVRNGTTWTPQPKITSRDGAANESFGYSVAVSGDTALVGAYVDDDNGVNAGAAYVFVRNGPMWIRQEKLGASDGVADDWFGRSVALSGDMALVGATGNIFAAVNTSPGSVYVFLRDGTTWTEQAKLTASDGTANDQFGTSVALSGDTALVGACEDDIVTMNGTNDRQGSVYVFVRNGTTWSQEAKLTANDGAVDDYFGYSVALSGDTALVGARFDDIGTKVDQGSAYVFVKPATGWADTAAYSAKLTVGDGAAGDFFGSSVALSGDTALVGAPYDNIGTKVDQGSAYVFVRNGSVWTEQAKLTAGDGAANALFGESVALSGDTALVGAWRDDIEAKLNQGSAYVFLKPVSGWTTSETHDAKLTASDGAASDYFGRSVALSEDGSVGGVGAFYGDDPEPDAGAVYLFSFIRSLGMSCGGDAACDSGLCVDGVCCNSPCNGPCQACAASLQELGTDGYCGPAAQGSNPGNRCPTEDPFTCGKSGTCTAVGTCAVYEYGTSCAEPVCTTMSNGVISKVCNGFGACTTNPQIEDCGTYQCTNGACNTTCATDADCAADAYCDTTASPSECAVKKNIGETCSPETKECKSGFCVDGVCCNEPCDSPCQACAASLKQLGTDGYCGPAKQGTKDDNCQADPGKPCGSTGQCNEFGACEIRAYGVNCGQSICQADIEYDEQICNGFGSCVPDPSTIRTCFPYQCDAASGNTSCKESCTNATESIDCASGYLCQNNLCTPSKTCTTKFDCDNGQDCDPATSRCIPAVTVVAPAESCDCQLPGRSSSPSRWPLIAVALTLVALRRLRARNPATHHRRAA